jgi:hypothetical protein
MCLNPQDLEDLRRAVVILENPGFAIRISNAIGTPIEKTFDLLPQTWSASVHEATQKAIGKALEAAIATLDSNNAWGESSNATHKILSGVSGAVGGFFGAPALALELPITTTIMLRSIADIGRSEGEYIAAPRSKLACLEVFAFGGKSAWDDGAETGYYAVRATLAKTVSEAAQYLSGKSYFEKSAPVLIRFVTKVASRFGITVSQKLAAQAVPAIGALGGASINLLFMNHFQGMARGHFIVRRLERSYGEEAIRLAYDRLRNDESMHSRGRRNDYT